MIRADDGVVRVLFVCLGNICRSPMAEGVFRSRVEAAGLFDRIIADSCGTGAWHIGNPPDPRGQAAALERGIDLSLLRARQVSTSDFSEFNFVIAMDRSNLAVLEDLAPEGHDAHMRLFLDFAPGDTAATGGEVPDPYYGGTEGFTHVLDLIEAASDGLLAHIRLDVLPA